MQQSDILIPIPIKGSAASADWAAQVARTLNARRLIAGAGIEFEKGPNGIVIKSTAKVGKTTVASALQPFTCRYATWDDTGNEYQGWEIYLPAGCVAIGSTHKPLNLPARRKVTGANNSERIEDVPDWYRLVISTENGLDTDYLTDDGSGIRRDTLSVTVHAKYFAALDDQDAFKQFPVHYFLVDATSHNDNGYTMEHQTAEWGDNFNAQVGVIEIAESMNADDLGEGESMQYNRSSRCTATGSIYMAAPESGRFDLIYSLHLDASGNIDRAKLYITNQRFNAAGVTFVGNRIYDPDISIGTNDLQKVFSIYLKIDTAKTPCEGTILTHTYNGEVAGGGEGNTITADDFITENKGPTDMIFLLYRLRGGRVEEENIAALDNVQIYM